MTKIRATIILTIGLFLFSACQKDEELSTPNFKNLPIYPDGTPKLKSVTDKNGIIIYLYNENNTLAEENFFAPDSDTPDFKSEYYYNSKKLAERIDYYWKEDLQFSEYFEYNANNQLVKSYLEELDWGYSNYFYHSNLKISRIEEYYNQDFLKSILNNPILNYHRVVHAPKYKEVGLYYITEFEYNDTEQLKSTHVYQQTSENENKLIMTSDFESDFKHNPFFLIGAPYFTEVFANPNNIITATIIDLTSDPETDTSYSINYVYNNNQYPVTAKISNTNETEIEESFFEYY